MKKSIFSVIAIGLLTSLAFFSCKKNDTTTSADIQETAQQVGDVMASVDESGGSSTGNLAYESYERSIKGTFDRYAPNSIDENMIASVLLPKAEATTCSAWGNVSTCNSSNVITRTFSGCTVGTATFNGTVTFTWNNPSASTCSMGATSQNVTRVPNFTVTGRRGATLTVTKSGTIGQRITWTSGATKSSGTFTFSNDGINRKFTAGSTTLFDQTTSTSGDITITGGDRSGRVMTGGALKVVDNLKNVTCSFVPNNVTWQSSCNCPTSGSWSGTCDDGKSVTLDINGCGTAKFTDGSDTTDVSFDRCGT